MNESHDSLCDRNHTPRQACNQDRAAVLEAPPTDQRLPDRAPPTLPPAPSQQPDPQNDVLHTGIAVPTPIAGPVDVMPAPSPWAVRAWEDTAAAVGATATPAPPVHELSASVDAEPVTGRLAGHAPLVVGLVAASALIIAVWRKLRH